MVKAIYGLYRHLLHRAELTSHRAELTSQTYDAGGINLVKEEIFQSLLFLKIRNIAADPEISSLMSLPCWGITPEI